MPTFGVGAGSWLGASLSIAAEDYDPGITEEVDRHIRNMPAVQNYILGKAHECLSSIGSDNFEIVLSTETGAEVFSEGSDVFGRTKYLKGVGANGLPATDKPHEKQRPRAYICPANSKGVHEEQAQGLLLKAAMGMAGK
jgi:hypothetical protein